MKAKPSYVEKQMDKMSNMWFNGLHDLEPLPEPDESGQIKLSNEKLHKLLKQRGRLSYSDGFFFGVSIMQ